MGKKILLFGIGLSMLFSMTACGKKSSEEPKSVFSNQSEKEETKEETLEDILSTKENKAAIQQDIDSSKKMFKDYYKDITFDVKGNDVTYTYILAEGVEVDMSEVDTSLLGQQADAFKKSAKETYKVTVSSVTYEYIDSEGNVLGSYKY